MPDAAAVDPTLTFLGATRTVTGSKFLLETSRGTVLVDCGLFQGLRELRDRSQESRPARSMRSSSPTRTSITAATCHD
jgi:metallo-beta-lactamase family protein